MNRFARCCFRCKDKILDHTITLENVHFHEHCIVCQDCGKGIQKSACVFRDQVLLCKPCHIAREIAKLDIDQGPQCAQCQKSITLEEPCVLVDGQRLHLHHELRCQICTLLLQGQAVTTKNGKITCIACSDARPTANCFACQRSIDDRLVVSQGKSFHPNCFVCYKCNNVLNTDLVVISGEATYCQACDPAQLTKHCPRCFLDVPRGKVQHALERVWCEACFTCSGCCAQLARFLPVDGQPMCETCFGELPRQTRKNLTSIYAKGKVYG
jgi:hypothetical protein